MSRLDAVTGIPTLCMQVVWTQAEATSHECVVQSIAGNDARACKHQTQILHCHLHALVQSSDGPAGGGLQLLMCQAGAQGSRQPVCCDMIPAPNFSMLTIKKMISI